MPLGPWQPIQFTFWSLGVLFLAAALTMAIYETRRTKLALRVPILLVSAWSAFAAYEAAGFHVGPQANQWFVIAFAPFPFVAAAVVLVQVFRPYWRKRQQR
jgi:hypothetical protein